MKLSSARVADVAVTAVFIAFISSLSAADELYMHAWVATSHAARGKGL